MNNKYISILLISILVLGSITIIPQIYAERDDDDDDKDEEKKYIDYKGDEITDKQYGKRLLYCVKMINQNIIHPDTNCPTWILTYDGEYMINSYIVNKILFK
jgi:hypothetical protein